MGKTTRRNTDDYKYSDGANRKDYGKRKKKEDSKPYNRKEERRKKRDGY